MRRCKSAWLAWGCVAAIICIGLFGLPGAVQASLPPRPEPVPTASPTVSPVRQPAGGTITLWMEQAQLSYWTHVQWQSQLGEWYTVQGWQGTFNSSNEVVWWVAPADLGKGPFRWQVLDGPGGAVLATSDPFYLPAARGAAVLVPVSLSE